MLFGQEENAFLLKFRCADEVLVFLQKEVVYQQKKCLMTSWRVGENDGVVIYTQIAGCWSVADGGLWCRVYHFTPEVNVNCQIGVTVYF